MRSSNSVDGRIEAIRLALLAADPALAHHLLAQLAWEPHTHRAWFAGRLQQQLAALMECWSESLEAGPDRQALLWLAGSAFFGPSRLH